MTFIKTTLRKPEYSTITYNNAKTYNTKNHNAYPYNTTQVLKLSMYNKAIQRNIHEIKYTWQYITTQKNIKKYKKNKMQHRMTPS